MRSRLADERGTSLIEVIVASSLVVLVLYAFLRFFDSSVASSAEQDASVQLHADSRVAVDQLVRELRQAYTGSLEDPVIESISDRQITFFTPDDRTPMGLRRVSYRVQDGTLQRQVASSNETETNEWTFGPASSWAPVMETVDADAFTGRGDDGEETADPAAVRRIDIELVGRDSASRVGRRIEVSVTLRNLR